MSVDEAEHTNDSLRMTSSTSVEDVQQFMKRRIQNPYIVDGKVIWNFSNYEPDMEALEFAAKKKLEKKKYVIPFQVTGTWGFMVQFLPKSLQRAEILVYQKQYGDYAAYSNLAAELDEKELEEWKEDALGDIQMLNLSP